ncbi:E3 ubiquitin/ISG15 ligase TRIM25 isoform X3 [Syngnathus scovelli]|uniref:E3 ubiquitin/ISG15 ligase TRIM25 isoform X3 n=1 Tax=Syngnathus scovelli TaxID=161590 RepID=UPI0035CACB64
MANVDNCERSLLSLGDELTCSICLCPFDCPVTIPCGHNFCQECLLATWKDSCIYSCPQCRTNYPIKPELKKNTVLNAVVETFKLRSTETEPDVPVSEMPGIQAARSAAAVRCDTCMEADAVKTCLTCMASYCTEHLRPHRENPVFHVHQLSEPVDDLLERICPEHRKIMELFCTKHDRLMCTLCLQQAHKSCDFITAEQQRTKQESNLIQQLSFTNKKIKQNETVILQMRDMQLTLKGNATAKKSAMAHQYELIRNMLANEERAAMSVVDEELESSHTKLRLLMKRFSENIDSLNKAKGDIQSLLCQAQTMAFLQASFNLPKAAAFEPYAPRIYLSSKKLTATQDFAGNLKKHIQEILSQPVGDRLPLAKTETKIQTGQAISSPGAAKSVNIKADKKWQQKNIQTGHPISSYPAATKAFDFKADKTWQKKHNKPIPPQEDGKQRMKNLSRSMENLLVSGGKLKHRPQLTHMPSEPKEKTETMDRPADVIGEKRHILVTYGTALSFDPKTAHKCIKLTEDLQEASVSDQPNPAMCSDCPERFSVFTQVLTSQGFTQGRHYWEVRLNNKEFTSIGLTYGSIKRKGPTSRLGRNAQSWCVEWVNDKLSAWHDNSEVVLMNIHAKRIGVLLDYDSGSATFYDVTDRMYCFYTFVFSFTEAVYPAFGIFRHESSITLCKLLA